MRTLRFLIVAALAASCATNPATGKRQLMLMSEQDEIQLGRTSDQEVRKEMGVYSDAELQRYVSGVGLRLAHTAHRPAVPWTYSVVDASAVNAFALPGGFIYVTRGILPFLRDEAELAAVLGHETGHVDARHSAAAYSRQQLVGGGIALGGALFPKVGAVQGAADLALGVLFLKNSRGDELEADRLGVGYASLAGWAPGAMPDLLATLGRLDGASGSSRGVPNWALTHPPAADRVARVQEAVAAAQASGGTATNRTEFERHLDGLVFGDSREQGLVRGSEFLHPILRLAVKFPAGWEIANGADEVTATPDENGTAAMVLQLVDATTGNVAEVARTTMANAGFTEVNGRAMSINGLSPYVGTYEGRKNNQTVSLRAAFIHLPQAPPTQFVLLAGLATGDRFGAVQSQFDAAISSFRPLSQQEADRVQPNRIDFYVVRPGDTWESIARGPSGGATKAATLSIMNGRGPETPPRAGERVRIVVGG
jgi:predicted Zn-dependent protease